MWGRPSACQAFKRLPWPVMLALAAYSILVLAAIYHHEPWADEAQSWLIARDVSLRDLWLTRLHYEGTPGLWQTLLHGLIALRLPYAAYNYVAGLLGIAAAWLVMRFAPFPLFVRLLLPFTFFLAYQYAVIARSYDLIPVLLFGCAAIYRHAERRLWLFTLLLCLLAAVSVHGLVLSACIAAGFLWLGPKRRDVLPAALTYLFVVGLMIAAAYPARDVTFVIRPRLSLEHWLEFSRLALSGAFTGEGFSTAAVLALSVPFLWRGRGLWIFLSSILILCTFGAGVYAQVWHQGLLFLAWLFALWISAGGGQPSKPALAALLVVIACQCYWTARSVAYDWNRQYSAGKQTARFIKGANLPRGNIYAVGYAAVAVKPYLARGEFAGGPAYWDWSVRNRLNDTASLMSSRDREYVLVGYKSEAERKRWAELLAAMGYRRIAHFDGNLFWHTKILEPESCDVFHRSSAGSNAASAIPMNRSGKLAVQLLSGFYGVEAGAWRWTAKSFSVVLKPPPGSERTGAMLRLVLFLPDQQIGKAGAVILRADADGAPLPPKTFSRAGSYVYAADMPASSLRFDAVCVNFHLDNATVQTGKDARELGLIATSVSLESN